MPRQTPQPCVNLLLQACWTADDFFMECPLTSLRIAFQNQFLRCSFRPHKDLIFFSFLKFNFHNIFYMGGFEFLENILFFEEISRELKMSLIISTMRAESPVCVRKGWRLTRITPS